MELTKTPITFLEKREKMESTYIGQKIKLRQYNLLREDNTDPLTVPETCTVIAKYPDVVIFARPNGMQCSRTYIELCMADRGVPI